MTNTSAEKGKNNPMRPDRLTIDPQSGIASGELKCGPMKPGQIYPMSLVTPPLAGLLKLQVGMTVESNKGNTGMVISVRAAREAALIAWSASPERFMGNGGLLKPGIFSYRLDGTPLTSRAPYIVASRFDSKSIVDREVLKERAKVKRLGLLWTVIIAAMVWGSLAVQRLWGA
ncbi:MAG: hypothetical protein AXW12_00630 [Thalassospira sp. Nap_22]|nr:MAG: hypothetical protein AXW12_00630 [Thalassospira sp. Nap_22]